MKALFGSASAGAFSFIGALNLSELLFIALVGVITCIVAVRLLTSGTNNTRPPTTPPARDRVAAEQANLETAFIRGPHTPPTDLRTTTSGAGWQNINSGIDASKIIFKSSGAVVDKMDLPQDVEIGGHKLTVMWFDAGRFIVNDYGVPLVLDIARHSEPDSNG